MELEKNLWKMYTYFPVLVITNETEIELVYIKHTFTLIIISWFWLKTCKLSWYHRSDYSKTRVNGFVNRPLFVVSSLFPHRIKEYILRDKESSFYRFRGRGRDHMDLCIYRYYNFTLVGFRSLFLDSFYRKREKKKYIYIFFSIMYLFK